MNKKLLSFLYLIYFLYASTYYYSIMRRVILDPEWFLLDHVYRVLGSTYAFILLPLAVYALYQLLRT